jgi:hypothetical protein
MTLFLLGVSQGRALEKLNVPLFITYRALAKYRRTGDHFPKARTVWALDSNGYSEIKEHGEWTISPDVYGGAVYRFLEDAGTRPIFVAPQDFMCEPEIIAKTGLGVAIHQELTTDSVLYLRGEFPAAPWIPVLQGWTLDQYLDHVERYAAVGIDLTIEPVVGLGSVCRRESTAEIGAIVSVLHGMGINLHGFGVKRQGLVRYGHYLYSADSHAWSAGARKRSIKLPGCEHSGPCNNCLRYALEWRADTLKALRQPQQQGLTLTFT